LILYFTLKLNDTPLLGVIRFLIMFICNVELAITEKVVKGPLAGVDAPLYIVVSVIFMCRFLLQIRGFGNLRLDSAINTTGLARNPSRSLSMFQAAKRKISDSLFGDLGATLSAADDDNEDGRRSLESHRSGSSGSGSEEHDLGATHVNRLINFTARRDVSG